MMKAPLTLMANVISGNIITTIPREFNFLVIQWNVFQGLDTSCIHITIEPT